MKKIIILLLGICSLLFIALSCGDNKAKIELKKIVAELNSHCPVQYDFGTCLGAQIEGGNLVFDYVCDDEMLRFEKANNDSEMVKKLYGSSILDVDESFADLIVRSGYGVTLNYKGSQSKEITTIHLRNEEIKQLAENPMSKNELLDWQVQITNSLLPMKVDEFTELVSMHNLNGVVSYCYELDDELLDLSQMTEIQKAIKESLKEEMEQEWTSPTSVSKQFLTLICRTNKSLQHVYRRKTSNKEVVVDFSNAELRNIFHDYIEEE